MYDDWRRNDLILKWHAIHHLSHNHCHDVIVSITKPENPLTSCSKKIFGICQWSEF